ncbi:MAG: dihydroneopterin aldolase, partial [Hymenobacter sp.]
MGQIALEGLEFFAFHGYYDEEQKIGNKYGVDIY